MSGTDSMTHHDSPQSMHPGDLSSLASSATDTLRVRVARLARSTTPPKAENNTAKVNAESSTNEVLRDPTTDTTSPSFSNSSTPTSSDSRIPRPSPTTLRRTFSMRMCGERVPSHPPPSTGSTVTLIRQQPHQQRRHNHLQHAEHHQRLDHRIFPVITENETDSPRQRSLSLSLTPARPRRGFAVSGDSKVNIVDDSDADSVKSYSSACSTASACDHATFALNGTTWSGRSRKYVVHCSNHSGENEQYLTPTQRAARQVRKFQALLKEAHKEIEEKDQEIFKLKKEVVELRLYKASLNSPDDRTDSSDALTVRENNPFSPESPCKDLPEESTLQKQVTSSDTPEKRIQSDMPSSLADSGHFEDGSVHSKDSVFLPEVQTEANNVVAPSSKVIPESSVSNAFCRTEVESPERNEERRRLVDHYENIIEEMHRRNVDDIQELKQKHNDKVESLLLQLTEVNTRYCEVRPSLDAAETRARELEAELEAVNTELMEQKTLLKEQEERNKQTYLKMYAKGQEAARLEQADQIIQQSHHTQPKVSVAELLQQLTVTQAELNNLKAMYRRIVEVRSNQGALDPEITLQFLKSAFYYFLTDKENHHGHLNAIQSILGFSEAEKHNIDKIHRSARK